MSNLRVKELLENREQLEADALDRPDIDPVDWLHALKEELDKKYPTWEEYIERLKIVCRSIPEEQIVTPV